MLSLPRFTRAITIRLSVVLSLASVLSAQRASQDPEALSVLRKAISAAGGQAAVRDIKDFAASGTVTYYWQGKEVSGPVEIQGRGHDQLRMDSHLEDGVHSVVVSHGKGKRTDPNSADGAPNHNVSNVGFLFLPLPTIQTAMDNPLASVALKGTDQIGSTPAYKIEIVSGIPEKLQGIESLRKLKTIDIFVDPSTWMIVAIRYPYVAGPGGRSITREVDFSDFRRVRGLTVPFSISDKAADLRTLTINLTEMEFNRGIEESAFQQ
jgi:hypothetical protein